ncbi:hypothetical protein, partial [Kosakonia sp. AG348]|uniref:hypothetical protein n=2 Tax=Kosakonia TaxID=1330547 RepID=UPI000E039D6C
VGMVLANRCHRQNMKTSIINGSEVSRLSVAIHAVAEEEGTLNISEPFIHFPAGTPVSDIWIWFEISNNEFIVAQKLYGIPTHHSS